MKFIIKSAALAIMFFIVGNLSAQNNMTDVVYCKNGAVIRGTIIEQIPGVSLKIQTSDGSVFVYKMEEVEKMTKEAIPNQQINTESQSEISGENMCVKARQDANLYYQGAGSYRGGIWATTLIGSPLLGLIPTLIATGRDLYDHELNYPDSKLWANREYANCYKNAAMKKRNKKAWTAWGVSTGVVVAVTIAAVAIVLQSADVGYSSPSYGYSW